MKKFFKYLGFGFLSVVVFFIGIAVISSVGGVDNEDTFPPFIEKAIPKLTSWNFEEYKLLLSEKGLNAVTPDQWELYINIFKKLGTFQSSGTPELKHFRTAVMIGSGTTTYTVYLVPLTFDTGDAQVQLGLQHNDGKVEINSVKFLSDLLLK